MCSTMWAQQLCYDGNILVPDLPIIKGFSYHLWHSLVVFPMVPNLHDPARIYEYLRLILWPCVMLFELKIT